MTRRLWCSSLSPSPLPPRARAVAGRGHGGGAAHGAQGAPPHPTPPPHPPPRLHFNPPLRPCTAPAGSPPSSPHTHTLFPPPRPLTPAIWLAPCPAGRRWRHMPRWPSGARAGGGGARRGAAVPWTSRHTPASRLPRKERSAPLPAAGAGRRRHASQRPHFSAHPHTFNTHHHHHHHHPAACPSTTCPRWRPRWWAPPWPAPWAPCPWLPTPCCASSADSGCRRGGGGGGRGRGGPLHSLPSATAVRRPAAVISRCSCDPWPRSPPLPSPPKPC